MKVFVSFDLDRDQTLRDFIIGRSKNPDLPCEVSGHSLKEAQTETQWDARRPYRDRPLVRPHPHAGFTHPRDKRSGQGGADG